MDTRFLQSFVHVVELGSMADAARRLDLTHTTVAQRIRALEASVGTALVRRVGRTVGPTLAGKRILERARAILREERDLLSEASATDLPAGPLRLGATPTGLKGLLPPVLRGWAARHPGVEVYIEPGTSGTLFNRIASGDLDAAVMVHPLFELPKAMAWSELRREPLILLTPATLNAAQPLAVLADWPLIRYDRNVVAGRLADQYLRGRGIAPTTLFELDGIDSIATLVAEGLGVSILPDWPTNGPPDPRVRRWPLPAPCPSRSVGIMWQRAGARAKLVEPFVQLARNATARRQAPAAALPLASVADFC